MSATYMKRGLINEAVTAARSAIAVDSTNRRGSNSLSITKLAHLFSQAALGARSVCGVIPEKVRWRYEG